MASIYRNKGRSVWMMKYYGPGGGKPIRESTGETNRQKAQKIADAKETDKGRGLPVAAGVGKIRFGAVSIDAKVSARTGMPIRSASGAVALYENDYRNNKYSSLGKQQIRIRLHLEPAFEGFKMAEIGPVQIGAYMDQRREDGASIALVNRELDILRRMFTICVERGLLLYAPKVPRLNEDNAREGFFERASFERVRVRLPEPLQHVVTFAYITGWRIDSEVLTRQWRHVSLDDGEVRLEPRETKNRKPRVFRLTAELRELLVERQRQHEAAAAAGHVCPWVFFRLVAKGRGGVKYPKPIKRFNKAWATACRAAQCHGKVPHDFRRSAIRNMVRSGIVERVAMQMSGHLTRAVLERYNIISEADLQQSAKLDGLVSSGVADPAAGTPAGTPAAQTGTDGPTFSEKG